MKNKLLYSFALTLLVGGNLSAGEAAVPVAEPPASAAPASDSTNGFDTGYGYYRGSYGYPYRRGRGYGGYGYRGRGCY